MKNKKVRVKQIISGRGTVIYDVIVGRVTEEGIWGKEYKVNTYSRGDKNKDKSWFTGGFFPFSTLISLRVLTK